MEEVQEVQPHGYMVHDANKEANPSPTSVSRQTRRHTRWLTVAIYVLFILLGQSGGTVLGRLYYARGGSSKWLAALVQLAAFPILIPYYFIAKVKDSNADDSQTKPPSTLMLAGIYATFGLFDAANSFMYSIGLQYLPVGTYSIICCSQLAFNSLFSFFLNSQKFTPSVINSLVLLTISSVLLAVDSVSENLPGVSKAKYAVGFVCTIAASAGYGLLLSLIQVCFTKVLKMETFKVVIDMTIHQQITAAAVTAIGLFASGEWNHLAKEMEAYQLGKVSYVLNLVWTAICWQIFSIGCIGLIFEVSSLFSNAISAVATPIVPVVAVFIFHEKMDGIKALSMLLAIWGFISYAYQQYLDDHKLQAGSGRYLICSEHKKDGN